MPRNGTTLVIVFTDRSINLLKILQKMYLFRGYLYVFLHVILDKITCIFGNFIRPDSDAVVATNRQNDYECDGDGFMFLKKIVDMGFLASQFLFSFFPFFTFLFIYE